MQRMLKHAVHPSVPGNNSTCGWPSVPVRPALIHVDGLVPTEMRTSSERLPRFQRFSERTPAPYSYRLLTRFWFACAIAWKEDGFRLVSEACPSQPLLPCGRCEHSTHAMHGLQCPVYLGQAIRSIVWPNHLQICATLQPSPHRHSLLRAVGRHCSCSVCKAWSCDRMVVLVY